MRRDTRTWEPISLSEAKVSFPSRYPTTVQSRKEQARGARMKSSNWRPGRMIDEGKKREREKTSRACGERERGGLMLKVPPLLASHHKPRALVHTVSFTVHKTPVSSRPAEAFRATSAASEDAKRWAAQGKARAGWHDNGPPPHFLSESPTSTCMSYLMPD